MNIEKIMIQVVVDLVNDLVQERKWTKVDLFKLFSVNLFVENENHELEKIVQTVKNSMTSSR